MRTYGTPKVCLEVCVRAMSHWYLQCKNQMHIIPMHMCVCAISENNTINDNSNETQSVVRVQTEWSAFYRIKKEREQQRKQCEKTE